MFASAYTFSQLFVLKCFSNNVSSCIMKNVVVIQNCYFFSNISIITLEGGLKEWLLKKLSLLRR